MITGDRELAIDAVDVLNDLMADFIAGSLVFLDYYQRYKTGHFSEDQIIACQKMCLSHIVLGCAKLSEFRKRFLPIISEEGRHTLRALDREFERRNVKDFRNTVAGHIWDKKLQRPLRHSEIMEKLHKITDGNVGTFLRWVNNPEGNTYPATILSVVETLRDSIADAYQIQSREIISR